MIKKVWLVGVVLGAVIINELLILAMHDFFWDASQLAINGSPYTGNFSGLTEALTSFPFWGLFLGPVCGVALIIMILRQKEEI